jgi:hypothetical protein
VRASFSCSLSALAHATIVATAKKKEKILTDVFIMFYFLITGFLGTGSKPCVPQG